jgi:hypothetical protein
MKVTALTLHLCMAYEFIGIIRIHQSQTIVLVIRNQSINSDPILEVFSIKTLPSKSMKAEGDTGSQEGGYIAAFHVLTPSKIKLIAAYLDQCISHIPPNAEGVSPLRCLIISKVEYQVSTDGLEETIKDSDGILVLNGSLGNGTLQKQCISGFGQSPEPSCK